MLIARCMPVAVTSNQLVYRVPAILNKLALDASAAVVKVAKCLEHELRR